MVLFRSTDKNLCVTIHPLGPSSSSHLTFNPSTRRLLAFLLFKDEFLGLEREGEREREGPRPHRRPVVGSRDDNPNVKGKHFDRQVVKHLPGLGTPLLFSLHSNRSFDGFPSPKSMAALFRLLHNLTRPSPNALSLARASQDISKGQNLEALAARGPFILISLPLCICCLLAFCNILCRGVWAFGEGAGSGEGVGLGGGADGGGGRGCKSALLLK